MEVRQLFPTADPVGEFTVFNIKGNAYRLITEINCKTGKIYSASTDSRCLQQMETTSTLTVSPD
jgi:mRNA-degrading endonuclease HigB of HigAB toxin-antitoxin module